MKTTRHNAVHCAVCGYTFDAATDMFGKAEPQDGSFSMCMRCGEIAVFQIGPLGVALREVTLSELAQFSRQPKYRVLMEVVNEMRSQHAPGTWLKDQT